MRSWRVLASRAFVNGVEVPITYADVFVVQRDDDPPGPNDWESHISSADHLELAPSVYALRFETPEDSTLTGQALLRFSDGKRHLFRGNGELHGFEP
jgi:hypothetical protein